MVTQSVSIVPAVVPTHQAKRPTLPKPPVIMAKSRGARSAFTTFWTNASYKSFGKPHFRESDVEEGAAMPLSSHPVHTNHDSQPPSLLEYDRRVPSSKLTIRQLLYIVGSHGIGAMVISGGINFAVAYGKSFPCRTQQTVFLVMPQTIHLREGKGKILLRSRS